MFILSDLSWNSYSAKIDGEVRFSFNRSVAEQPFYPSESLNSEVKELPKDLKECSSQGAHIGLKLLHSMNLEL